MCSSDLGDGVAIIVPFEIVTHQIPLSFIAQRTHLIRLGIANWLRVCFVVVSQSEQW